MTLHILMWILVIIFVVRFLMNYFSNNKNIKKLSNINATILFIGGFGFLLAIFYQNLGFYGALSAIQQAQDISPAIILGGLKVSLIAPLYSLFLFLITGLVWFVFRNLIRE